MPALRVCYFLAAFGLLGSSAAAPPSPAVSMVVTAEGRKDKPAPDITQADVMIYQGKDRLRVTGWTPFRPEQPDLALYLLLDDALGDGFGTLLDDIRRFVQSMPPRAAVGLAYMQHGSAVVLQQPSADHSTLSGKIRLPMGNPGISPSPYLSVEDLVKHWPKQAARREVLVISDGIERLDVSYPEDPYLDAAVAAAQRAGVVVHTIYASAGDHFGHTIWRVNWAQSLLSQLADRTGGESFFEGLTTPVSLQPYLNALSHRLAHQYLLTFVPRTSKPGLVPVRVRTEIPGVDLVAADRVYVPGTGTE